MKNITGYLFIALCFLLTGSVCFAETPSMAVLPFTVTSESGLDYLGTGLIDLLSSRIAYKNNVTMIDKATTVPMFQGSTLPPKEKILDVGKKTHARFLVTGSLDETSQGVTLQVFVIDGASGKPLHEYTEKSVNIKGDEAVMPLVDRIVDKINRDLFSHPMPAEEAPTEAEKPYNVHAHPDTLIEFLPKDDDK